MKKEKLIFIIILHSIIQNVILGQEKYQIDLLKENKIKCIEFYNYNIEEGEILPDSMMNLKTEFNSKGYVVNTIIYDSLKMKHRYEKIYSKDTILTGMRTYFGSDSIVQVVTQFEYEEGKRISEIHFKEEGKIIDVKYFYNKQNLLSKSIAKYKGGVIHKSKFKYNTNNQLLKRRNNRKVWSKLGYDNEGRHVSTTRVFKGKGEKEFYVIKYKGDTDQVVNKVTKFYTSRTLIGEGGVLKVKEGDTLKKEYFYHKNGLINYVEQYLNNKLDAVKKYKYLL